MRADAVALVPAPLTLVSRRAGYTHDAPALRVFGRYRHALGASGVYSVRRIHEGDLGAAQRGGGAVRGGIAKCSCLNR